MCIYICIALFILAAVSHHQAELFRRRNINVALAFNVTPALCESALENICVCVVFFVFVLFAFVWLF